MLADPINFTDSSGNAVSIPNADFEYNSDVRRAFRDNVIGIPIVGGLVWLVGEATVGAFFPTSRAEQLETYSATQMSFLPVPGIVAGPSSRALGRALEGARFARPAQSAAHHIVAGGAEAAAPARAALQSFEVGINEAANGVFLPANRAAQNAAGAAVHSQLHTRAYYETVNQLVGQAATRGELLETLNALAQALRAGAFPW